MHERREQGVERAAASECALDQLAQERAIAAVERLARGVGLDELVAESAAALHADQDLERQIAHRSGARLVASAHGLAARAGFLHEDTGRKRPALSRSPRHQSPAAIDFLPAGLTRTSSSAPRPQATTGPSEGPASAALRTVPGAAPRATRSKTRARSTVTSISPNTVRAPGHGVTARTWRATRSASALQSIAPCSLRSLRQ